MQINEDFIAQYQMQYGTADAVKDKDHPDSTGQSKAPPPEVSRDPEAYWKYYYGDKQPDVQDPNYPAWYAYYYGSASTDDLR